MRCVGLLCAAWLCGCSDPGAEITVDTVRAIVGADGGELALTDGTRVQIPAGALAALTEISITVTTDAAVPEAIGVAAGRAYRIEPSGLELAVPAEITLPFDPLKDGRALMSLCSWRTKVLRTRASRLRSATTCA